MKNILIAIDTSRASGRKFMAGVGRYISAFADWQVLIKPPGYLPGKDPVAWPQLHVRNLDGLILRDATATLNLLQIDRPKVINDTQRELIPGTSSIMTDSEAIGRLAAEYFIGLGFQNFAFCGFRGLAWSRKRKASFQKALQDQGVDRVFSYWHDAPGLRRGGTIAWKISEWLKDLPRPIAVFACNDDGAVYVLQACKIAGLPVPEEVAVLGVDNDELVCNFSPPSLSSMELAFENAGFQAARHLDDLIRHRVEPKVILVRPLEIVSRRSTDILVLEDEFVAKALVFIRANYQEPIQAADVVDAACISRRELEKRFKKNLRRTIKGEIDRLRIEWIKKKLLYSNEPVYRIAESLTFTDPEHFPRFFKKSTGMTPAAFRKER